MSQQITAATYSQGFFTKLECTTLEMKPQILGTLETDGDSQNIKCFV
jgi:hypothetical protein